MFGFSQGPSVKVACITPGKVDCFLKLHLLKGSSSTTTFKRTVKSSTTNLNGPSQWESQDDQLSPNRLRALSWLGLPQRAFKQAIKNLPQTPVSAKHSNPGCVPDSGIFSPALAHCFALKMVDIDISAAIKPKNQTEIANLLSSPHPPITDNKTNEQALLSKTFRHQTYSDFLPNSRYQKSKGWNCILPNTKLSGRKIWPKGPDLTESMVPGSKSTKMARGTYLPPRKK